VKELLLVWAKLGSETWPEKYHPVLCHLIDVGQVARRLWDKGVFRRKMREWITTRLGLPDESAAGAWLAFWAAAHDIGKVSPDFQAQGKTDELKTRLAAAGFNFEHSGEKKQHGVLSTVVLAAELPRGRDWPAVDVSVARNVAVAVGGHHGIFPTNWDGICGPLGNERWAAARREMLAELARLFRIRDLPAPTVALSDDQSVWMYVAGLTSVADWVGSDQEFFEPVGSAAVVEGHFDVEDYFAKAGRQAAEALAKLGWLGRADTTKPVTFAELFAFQPRPLQTAVAGIVGAMTEPSLLIVEAPMGEGKTEAGWYAAACWDRRGGQGVYVALPTMATSNQMFDRVGKFLEANAGKKNLMLQHGKAALNDQFAKLKYAAQVYDDEQRPSTVVAEGWFAANKKHGLLAPFGVGTIDQALLAVLQTKHVFVRLFGLAGKCVILDEVHAYDAYMTTLMERLLRWLAALGCPVVLLSATLPWDKRLKLMRAYAGHELPEPDAVSYPRMTHVAVRGHAAAMHVEADQARARTVGLGWLHEDGLVEKLRQSLAGGGCAAVIRNTVGLAQQTYLRLRDALKQDGIAVELFHARFPFGRRKQIEDEVLKWYGRTEDDLVDDAGRIVLAPHRPAKSVLVATQVVEQSLDLDFDLMVSDVAPVDLVLQRAGRLHRHARGQRPKGIAEPRLWLIEPEVKEGLPNFGVCGVVYSPHILFRSLLTLRSDGGVTRENFALPAEIDGLVNQVYDDSPAPDSLSSAERDFWASTLAKHQETIEKEEGEAETRQIRKPQFRGALARVVQEPREEDNPDLHPAHQALTRLTGPTVSLICLESDDNGSYRLPHDSSPVHTLAIRKMSQGGVEDVGRLMLGEVTSAHRGVINQLREVPLTPPAWVDVGLLCRHHLVLFTKGKASLGAYELVLDNSVGLTIIRTNAEGEDE
jgi:CRISPR-associated endonuclease/helicase Cas3